MPITPRLLQQRLTQVGVIRLGEKRLSKNGRPYPAKLETFRVTSPSRQVIEKVAEMFGGEVRDWPDGPTGPEFQVTTTTNELPVYVLPQRIDPNLELWGNRHRVRLCDGETEKIRNTSCLCEQSARQRYQRAGRPWPEDGKFQRDPRSECKPTTRLSVMLQDVSDGQWKVEAHGWNAAAELPTKATVYLALAQKPVPAVLRLRIRTDAILTIQPDGSEKVESREYAVPELDFGDLFNARIALTGGMDAAVTRALTGGGRPAIGAAPAPVEAADDGDNEETATRVDFYALAKLARDADAIRKLWTQAKQVDALNDALAAHLKERAAALEAKPAQAHGPVEVVEAEVEPDRDEVWTAILREAKTHDWNLPTVEAKYRERMGHDPSEEAATGWKYTEFLTALRNGEVQ